MRGVRGTANLPVRAMILTVQAPVPSLALFQTFTGQLIQLKELARAPDASPAVIDISPDENGAVAAVPGRVTSIWNRTLTLLDRQVQEATRLGGPAGAEFHQQALYAMAALADETFVHLDWDGRDYWLNHLLEWRVFHSHAAGDLFFRRIDGLLRREDDSAVEVATVYLLALALGFRGKYWTPEHQPALDTYRACLFAFIARRDPELAQPLQRLFPQAYRNTIQTSAPLKLVTPRRWLWALGIAVFAWLAVAQYLWWDLTGPMNQKIERLASGSAESR
jgi:type VI secretion system protein ImpK